MIPSDENADGPLPATVQAVPWEFVIARSWSKLALTFAAALSVASVIWQTTHRDLIYDFVFRSEVVANADHQPARQALILLVGVAALVAAALCVVVLRRVRRGGPVGAIHRELLVTSLLPLPLLTVPAIEFEHPLFTGGIVIAFSLALAWTISREVIDLPAPRDLTRRQAMLLVAAAMVVFAATIGFIAYWRYITFHAQVCDASWETNSVWGIIHHGIPTISIAAWFYDGQPLPAPYFKDHVPFIDYLYAPFFAIYPDGRTLVWMQAIFMGTGAMGAYLIGRHWLGTRLAGVLAAWLYILNPNVQSLCLHDVHPNILVIPALMLAVGLMEAKRSWAALVFAMLAAICHEETPVYAIGLGLFWMLSGEDRRRFRIGLGTCVLSVALIVLFSAVLMPRFGGQPRWEHFNLFFDERRSSASLVGALALNPLASALAAASDLKGDYLAISLIPIGALALFGWKAGWFALPAVLLLVPSSSPGFFCPGMNYSTPLVPAVLLMGLAGLRRWWGQSPSAPRGHRLMVAVYAIATALLGNYLYGNIASKTFKMEYGVYPYRRQNQYNYRTMMGYMDALPPFGPVERQLWDVIRHVPPRAPVLTSWMINPQLANRDISLTFGYSGGTPAPEERVDYVVIDKLPASESATENHIARFRTDPRWSVLYENNSGVIFARQRH
jgi:uncharacterized membrane protein